MFIINKTDKEKFLLRNVSPDLKKYFMLHGARIVHDNVIITLRDYNIEVEGNKMLLWRDCNWLDNNTLLCKNHTLKPYMCYDLNEKTTNKYYVTKGCKYETPQ